METQEGGLMKLRFSIRDLLWLTLVAGMAMAWWIDRRAMKHELDDFEEMPECGFSQGPTFYFRKSEIPDPPLFLIP
jgi:hypothetical protein